MVIIDVFLLALAATVALAALLPAHGHAAEIVSVAAKAAIALVFFPAATVGLTMLPLMLFHQIQHVVCALIASALARRADDRAAPTVGEGR